MNEDIDPQDLMNLSEQFHGLVDVATSTRQKAMSEGYSPTAAEQMAMHAFQIAAVRAAVGPSEYKPAQVYVNALRGWWRISLVVAAMYLAIAIAVLVNRGSGFDFGLYLIVSAIWCIIALVARREGRRLDPTNSRNNP